MAPSRTKAIWGGVAIAALAVIAMLSVTVVLVNQARSQRAAKPSGPIAIECPIVCQNLTDEPTTLWINDTMLGTIGPNAAVAFAHDRFAAEIDFAITAVSRRDDGTHATNTILVPNPGLALKAVRVSWGGIKTDGASAALREWDGSMPDDEMLGAVFKTQWPLIQSHEPGAPFLGALVEAAQGHTDLQLGVLAVTMHPSSPAPDRARMSYATNSSGMLFVRIPSGEVSVRLPASSAPGARANITRDYYMSVAEITVEQFTGDALAVTGAPNLPATSVLWQDAVDWCAAQQDIPGWEYKLPTWAQWERACQAGRGAMYSPENQPAQSFMWYVLSSGGSPRPVAQLLPNGYGLFDMHGNVHEWCRDWFDGRIVLSGNDPILLNPPKNWIGQPERVRRGGGYSSSARECRCGLRDAATPDYAYPYQGFRPVLELARDRP